MALFDQKKTADRKSNRDEYILSDKSPWPVQEAYKALRTNITFSLPGSECKVIGVTSALQHDGKTINAINTAISFAELGKRVLLIECDLRLPAVGKRLGIESVPGISDWVIGHADLKAVLRSKVRGGLDVIPSGNLPPDPTWLLQSAQMGKLIEAVRKFYDYVFVDLPPVLTVADASIIAKLTDGFLVVVRDQVTTYPAVGEMIHQLQFAGAKIIGILYNDKVDQGSHYYKSGYYYK